MFVSEYAAFPLRLIQGLTQMRQHYLRHRSYNKSFLHNDYSVMFTDIVPPDAREMQQLQDIFYPSLAFNLLPLNPQTGLHELQYYDRLRDTHQVNTLSSVWDEALEQLANVKDMAVALNQKLDEAIADITSNPSKWEGEYLPKLRKFVADVDELSETDPNYLYKETVVGTRETLDTKAKEGIINSFWRRMIETIEKQKQQQAASTSLPSQNRQALLNRTTVKTTVNNSQPAEYNTGSDTILDADFTDSDLSNAKDNISSIEQLEQLERLDNLLDKGRITEAEYQILKRNLFNS